MPCAMTPTTTHELRAELRRLLAYHRIKPEHTVHSHCGGGVAASVPWFAFKFLAGQPVKKIIVVPGRIINVVV